jgi:hypothetical protein
MGDQEPRVMIEKFVRNAPPIETNFAITTLAQFLVANCGAPHWRSLDAKRRELPRADRKHHERPDISPSHPPRL